MADLTLSVGPVTSTVAANDAAAADVLRKFVAAYDGPVNGNNQQQADFVVARLRAHLVEVARGQRRREKVAAAEADAAAENAAVDW
jgi:hypothetical protein